MPIEYKTCDSCPQTIWHHNGKCDRCGKNMPKVFPEQEHTTQFVGALGIDFNGGYGMNFDGPPQRYIVCHECAADLRDKEPWIQLESF